MAADLDCQLAALLGATPEGGIVVDGSKLQAIDSAGVYLLKQQLPAGGTHRPASLRGWQTGSAKLMELVVSQDRRPRPPPPQPSSLERLGRRAVAA